MLHGSRCAGPTSSPALLAAQVGEEKFAVGPKVVVLNIG